MKEIKNGRKERNIKRMKGKRKKGGKERRTET